METSMKVSDFISDCVDVLHYKCHKQSFKGGRLYLGSSDWIKNKKDSTRFQYAATVTLNHRNKNISA